MQIFKHSRTSRSRITSIITMFALMLALVPAAVSPVTAVTSPFVGVGFSVQYTTNNTGGGTYSVECNVTNTSAETLQNWAIGFDLDGTVTNIWSASVAFAENSYAIIKNTGWNANIAPGASVNFGMQLQGAENVPDSFDWCIPSLVENENISVSFNLIDSTSTTFFGQFTVVNTGTTTLDNWAFSFDFPATINNVDSGNLVSHDGTKHLIKDAGWNANLAPNASATVTVFGDGQGSYDVTNIFGQNQQYLRLVEDEDAYANLDWNDNDEDGLPNWQEEVLGTDKNNPDTDGDGLSDGDEVQYGTDPLVDDAGLDYDDDGLTNCQEILTYHTDVWSADTDKDGLSDGEEVNVYGTDPLVADTDEDGLSDGTEVSIGISLADPLNPDTNGNGILDGDEVFTQKPPLNVPETAQIVPEIEFTGVGDYAGKISANEFKMPDVQEQEFILGELYDFAHGDDLTFESSTLTYKISPELLENHNISDLKIAYFDPDTRDVEWLNTVVVDAETVRATVTHYSVYVLADYMQYLAKITNVSSTPPSRVAMPLALQLLYKPNSLGTVEYVQYDYKTGHVYKLLDEERTWEEAKEFCESLGGHLVTITTQHESHFLAYRDMFSGGTGFGTGSGSAVFVGFNYFGGWVTGEQLTFTNWQSERATPDADRPYVYTASPAGFWRVCNSFKKGISICEWDSMPGFPVDKSVKVRIFGHAFDTVELGKSPYLGDTTYDSDGDELPDLTELDREQTYNYTIAGIPRAVPYWTVHSRPDMADSDGDGLGDLHDPLPMTRSNVMEFVEKVGELEEVARDHLENERKFTVFPNVSNEDVKKYVVRVLGSFKENKHADVLSWHFTSGDAHYLFSMSLNYNMPELVKFFEQTTFLGYNGETIDFLHMMQTMSAYHHAFVVPDDVAGWAGDLQSFIYETKLRWGMEVVPGLSDYGYVYQKIFTDETHFPMSDLYADADALNIHQGFNANDSLSSVLENYYKHETINRFIFFLDHMGGWDHFAQKAIEYTHGLLDPNLTEYILLTEYAVLAAKQAGDLSLAYVTIPEADALANGFLDRFWELLL